MSFYLKFFPFAVILQLIFSELLTFNGYQANIMLLFVILSSMPLENNTWKSTVNGFLVGLFTDFVLFSGVYIGVSGLVFSICGFWASKVSHNFAFRNFDLYWVAFVHLGVIIYSLFRYDYFFFNDFLLFLSNYFFVTYLTCFVGFILIRIFSLKEMILNA